MHGEVAEPEDLAPDLLVGVAGGGRDARMGDGRRVDVLQGVAEVVDLGHPGVGVFLEGRFQLDHQLLGHVVDRLADPVGLDGPQVGQQVGVEDLVGGCLPDIGRSGADTRAQQKDRKQEQELFLSFHDT